MKTAAVSQINVNITEDIIKENISMPIWLDVAKNCKHSGHQTHIGFNGYGVINA